MKVVEAETAKGNKNFTLFHKNVKIFRSYQQKKTIWGKLTAAPTKKNKQTNKTPKSTTEGTLPRLCKGWCVCGPRCTEEARQNNKVPDAKF